MCIVCREKFNQNQLLRVSFRSGYIKIFPNFDDNGRGCYVCNTSKCIKGLTKQTVENGLRTGLSDVDWSRLDSQLNKLLVKAK